MKPDFSGEYVLNREASTLSPLGAVNVQTASLNIKHDEPTFGCEGKFSFLNGETAKWSFELRLAEQLRGTNHDQDNLWVFDRR